MKKEITPDFIELQHRLPLHSGHCETSTGKFSPFIHPDEANEIIIPCNGKGINIIDCKNPILEKAIDELDGLSLLTIKATSSAQLFLPQYIPIISGDFFNIDPSLVKYETIGISLKDVFTSSPKNYLGRKRMSKLSFKKNIFKLPLFKAKRIILFSSGNDVLIEKIWEEREILDYFKKINDIGFNLITAIDFSVYLGECPLGHAINLKKSLKSFSLLEMFGTIAIPHIYWVNKYHLQRWVEWLNLNKKIDLVTINCQMLKKAEYRLAQEGIKYLINNTNKKIHFLLEGPKRKFLEGFPEISSVIHVAIKDPAYVARNYRKYEYKNNKLKRINVNDLTKERLLELNIKIYNTYLQDNFFKKTTDKHF